MGCSASKIASEPVHVHGKTSHGSRKTTLVLSSSIHHTSDEDKTRYKQPSSNNMHHVNDNNEMKDEVQNRDNKQEYYKQDVSDKQVGDEHSLNDEQSGSDKNHARDKQSVSDDQQVHEEHHCSNNQSFSVEQSVSDKQKDGDGQLVSDEHYVSTPFDYTLVDAHARNAPPESGKSVETLVAYLTQVSSEPRMIVRAFFVWISENIPYDIGVFFGMVPTDGSSVGEVYANVMTILCREAGIPVQKISGFSKGYDSSLKPISSFFKNVVGTVHAWNAVQLDGKWFLIDSTWGSGYIDTNYAFETSFDEFYFLTDPQQFVYSHFPYMDNDMEASNKWQLLKKPITLEEFNNIVNINSEVFQLSGTLECHAEGVLRMKNEAMLTIKHDGNEEMDYKTTLWYEGHYMMHNVFSQIENGLFTTRIHPHTTGTFLLTIIGVKTNEEGMTFPQSLAYVIHCEKTDNASFTFPHSYTAYTAKTDQCILIAPLQGNLEENSEVEFHITSPHLKRIKVNKTFLEKNGTSFKGKVKTGTKGESLWVYGSRDPEACIDGLYSFNVV